MSERLCHRETLSEKEFVRKRPGQREKERKTLSERTLSERDLVEERPSQREPLLVRDVVREINHCKETLSERRIFV